MLPQVVATPHIAASTREGQELVGVETAAALRDFLRDGIIRNAVNFPSVSAEEFGRLRPFVELGERLGAFLSQMNDGRAQSLGIRYYGGLAEGRNDMIASAVLVGLFKPILSSGVTLVNARSVAADRGIEIVESRSSRPRNYTNLISVKLQTSDGERWVEGAVFERTSPRLVLVDGITVEAPLEGTMIVIRNNDQPGVIGEIGTNARTPWREHRQLRAGPRGHQRHRRGHRGRNGANTRLSCSKTCGRSKPFEKRASSECSQRAGSGALRRVRFAAPPYVVTPARWGLIDANAWRVQRARESLSVEPSARLSSSTAPSSTAATRYSAKDFVTNTDQEDAGRRAEDRRPLDAILARILRDSGERHGRSRR